MAVTSGFFNSLNGDRKYNAIQVSSIFDGIIRDGVFMYVGERFMVHAVQDSMNVNVDTGRAWFNQSWTLNETLLPLTIEPADPVMDRIDAIVIDVDGEIPVRANDIIVVTGTPSLNPVPPTLIRETNHNQYEIAEIRVAKGILSITQSAITYKVGQGDTPFVTSPLEHIDIEDMILQWEAQFNEWIISEEVKMTTWADQQRQLWQNWQNTFRNEMLDWENDSKEQFDQWFSELQVVLDGDVATNLFNKIDQHERTDVGENNTGVHGIRYWEGKLQIRVPDGWVTVGTSRYGLTVSYIENLQKTCGELESYGYTVGQINTMLEKE